MHESTERTGPKHRVPARFQGTVTEVGKDIVVLVVREASDLGILVPESGEEAMTILLLIDR